MVITEKKVYFSDTVNLRGKTKETKKKPTHTKNLVLILLTFAQLSEKIILKK